MVVQEKVIVRLKNGLQARPASFFVQEANRFSSEIFIGKRNQKLNAKSIIGIMSLGIASGTEVVIGAEGFDEEQAVDRLKQLLSEE